MKTVPIAVAACSLLMLSFAPFAHASKTRRLSVDAAGAQAMGGESYAPAISANGRFVAFTSETTNLVPGDTNGQDDVFVSDRRTGRIERASVSSSEAQASGGRSVYPAISASGRFVAFSSGATDLVPGDTNGGYDIFVRDRKKGTTTRVSVDSAGGEAMGGGSGEAAISANGRFIAFDSSTTNLVPGDTNNMSDVFVHDRKTGVTTRVSVDSNGAQAIGGQSVSPSISANGRFVAFESEATNLVPGDSNAKQDVFVHDRETGITTRVSVESSGLQSDDDSGNAAISKNGRFVAFESEATNLVAGDTNSDGDVFVRDRENGITTRVSVDSIGEQSNGESHAPAISANGRFVAFASRSVNLVAGDVNGLQDVFVVDRKTGKVERASVSTAGAEAAGGDSGEPRISRNGRFVVFESTATNLVAGDTNAEYDAFLRDRK